MLHILKKLVELFERGKGKKNKSYRVTTEKGYDITRNDIIYNDRSQQQILIFSKIKSFLKKT